MGIVPGMCLFLSTLSLRRATPQGCRPAAPADISIHALLAESDGVIPDGHAGIEISIHALLAESDALRWPRVSG